MTCDRWANAIARRGITVLLALVALAYVAGMIGHLKLGEGHTLYVGDGFYYYCYLPSLVLDGDLDFTNQYALGDANGWGHVGTDTPTAYFGVVGATGRPANAWSIGPALLWLPFFLVGLAGDYLLGQGAVNGFGPYSQALTYLGSGVYGGLGIYLLLYRGLAGFSVRTRTVTMVLLVFGTSLNYYLLLAGQMSHGLSFFAVCLFLFCTQALLRRPDRISAYLLSGLSLGLIALIRWQDAVLGIMAVFAVVVALRQAVSVRVRIAGPLKLVAGLGIAAVIQAVVWQSIYDAPLVIPQGKEWMTWSDPHLGAVLFSYPHGLFVNSPLLMLGLFGLWSYRKRDAAWAWSSLLTIAVAVYVCAAVSQWWGGESFGMRRLISVYPLMGFGLAEVLETAMGRPYAWRVATAGGAVAGLVWNWNVLLRFLH